MNSIDLSSKLAIDANNLGDLKMSARENSPEAIKEVAKQFEAIFMNMMLKSMRDATPQDSPFENEQTRTFTSMLDQQLSSSLTSKGLGLADVLAKQLSKTGYRNMQDMQQAVSSDRPSLESNSALPSMQNKPSAWNPAMIGLPTGLNTTTATPANNAVQPTSIPVANTASADNAFTPLPWATKVPASSFSDSTSAFQARMAPHAEAASRATGMPANLMIGQAALETGWGKREIKGADGTNSFNLFGIKAGSNWNGKVVEATTTEYINGVKQKRIEKFRAYDSYADSFKDFANMIRNNPRYENVVSNMQSVQQYSQAMQNAGYATDPEYASKLSKVILKLTQG